MMVASGRPERNSVNAATSRNGPRMLVVTTASAVSRKPLVVKSSGRMIPAIAMSTLVSGKRCCTSVLTRVMSSASAVSMRTVWTPGWAAAISSSSAVRVHR